MTWTETLVWVIAPLALAYAGCVLVTPEARLRRRDRALRRRDPQRAALRALARLNGGNDDHRP